MTTYSENESDIISIGHGTAADFHKAADEMDRYPQQRHSADVRRGIPGRPHLPPHGKGEHVQPSPRQ